MGKAIIAIVAIILVIPILYMIIPKDLDYERIQQGFLDAGLRVTEVQMVDKPSNQADRALWMNVNGTSVSIYWYSDPTKMATYFDERAPVGEPLGIQAWNMSESIVSPQRRGRPSPELPDTMSRARNESFMLIVESDDEELRGRIVQIFQGL